MKRGYWLSNSVSLIWLAYLILQESWEFFKWIWNINMQLENQTQINLNWLLKMRAPLRAGGIILSVNFSQDLKQGLRLVIKTLWKATWLLFMKEKVAIECDICESKKPI